MMKWLRKHRYTIFLITVGGFLVGSFMGFGSYFFTQSPYDAALVVNGEKVSYKRYQTRLRQYLQQRREQDGALTQEKMDLLKKETVQDLVRETVFLQEAEKYGLVATDNELAAYIQRAPAFQKDGRFDQATYLQVVHQVLRIPPEEFEEDRRRELKIQKLQSLMASAVKISDAELRLELQKRMARADVKTRKALLENPQALREEMRQAQVANVFQEWLGQMNSQLKVKVLLNRWEGRGDT